MIEPSAGDSRPRQLRKLLAGDGVVVMPGASDAWTAKLIDKAGFPAAYVTGAGIANSMLGVPDIGLTTQTEMVTQIGHIAAAVDIPVLADADTGFGGVANIQRTIREYERIGVAGLHLEDQEMPKRCGHFAGKSVVSIEDMVLRLHAALDARADSDFMIIARTDARGVEGFDRAIERAKAYAHTGVDAIFIEALESADEFRRAGEALAGVPLIANMVEGGRSPLIPSAELGQMGYRIVLHANLALRVGAFAITRALQELREEGTSAGLLDTMLPWDERQDLVGLDQVIETENRLLRMTSATLDELGLPSEE
jgi:2-methylisocitrate lyase-like PEP mutase family enzyme